jgi:hypothetical protein
MMLKQVAQRISVLTLGALQPIIEEFGFSINSLIRQWTMTTLAQITGNQNDYSVGMAGVARISSDAARNITGFTQGVDGNSLMLVNVGSFAITIQHQNAGSVATNRVILLSGADTAIAANGVMWLLYDQTTGRWRQVK